MKRALFLAILASAPHEERVPVGGATLYAREIGRGQPIVVLHGGPDFVPSSPSSTRFGTRSVSRA